MNYQDHFAQQSKNYLKYRPNYPLSLFEYLAGLCSSHELAWDCGTGNGQAASMLATYFKKIIATDLNQAQLNVAITASNVEYRCMKAEHTDISNQTIDLITVAQALHWFDLNEFYAEARRVLKPQGIIAAWCYGLCGVSPKIDKIIQQLYSEILSWPKERTYIDAGYRTIPFAFKTQPAPSFEITQVWDLSQLVHYLYTWSAVKEYQKNHQADPILLILEPLQTAWGDPAKAKSIHWGINMLLGK